MATRNFVPRQDNDGNIGTKGSTGKRWASINTYETNSKDVNATNINATNAQITEIQSDSISANNIEILSNTVTNQVIAQRAVQTPTLILAEGNNKITLTTTLLTDVLNSNTKGLDDKDNVVSETYATIDEDKNPTTSIIPKTDNSIDLGANNNNWKNIYGINVHSTNLNSTQITVTNAISTNNFQANNATITNTLTALKKIITTDLTVTQELITPAIKVMNETTGEKLEISPSNLMIQVTENGDYTFA